MKQQSLFLSFPAEIADKPVLSLLIKRFDIEVNIIQANIAPDEDGNMLIIMKGNAQNYDQAIRYLEKMDIKILFLKEKINWIEDLCVNCGACIGQCNYQALSLDENNYKLTIDNTKCIGCELCIPACSYGALSLINYQDLYKEDPNDKNN